MNKKFFLFFLCFILSSIPIFADDELSNDGEPVQIDEFDTSSPASVVVDITQLLNSKDNSEDETIKEVFTIDPEIVGYEQSVLRVSPSDTNGFKAVLLTILGDYETVVTDYEYRTANNTYTSHSINIERDWAWLASACMLGLLTYCTFRIIGGMLCKR